ncbi:hypothetical protein CBM2637_A50008 [Cupriavidus taiwanensis]|nr:hypothetical protein CBM2637_A50008 [Cupriavidus taiwanensis]
MEAPALSPGPSPARGRGEQTSESLMPVAMVQRPAVFSPLAGAGRGRGQARPSPTHFKQT